MSKVTIHDKTGSAMGEMDIGDATLELKWGRQAVHDVVVAQLAGRRAGTADTLRKGEVAGSNKKPWRQKGTGRARAGYRQSPVWRGGGVAFGPHPRDFGLKINKKVVRLAFRRAFSDKVKAGALRVMDTIEVTAPKTQEVAAILKALAITGPALFVVDAVDRNLALACRNIPNVEVAAARDVSVYQLVRYPVLVASKKGLAGIQTRMDGGAK